MLALIRKAAVSSLQACFFGILQVMKVIIYWKSIKNRIKNHPAIPILNGFIMYQPFIPILLLMMKGNIF